MSLSRSTAVFLFFSLVSWTVKATTYFPLPIEKQLNEAKAVIKGEYQGATYKKVRGGEVVTVASFKIHESMGLKDNELLNRNDFKVIFPGGKWNKMVYSIDGAPKFTVGETSILILGQSPYGHVLSGLSLGKYEIVKRNGIVGLSSSVFPEHPKLGFMALNQFNQNLSQRFGKALTTMSADKAYGLTVADNGRAPSSLARAEGNYRGPASVGDTVYQASTESINIFWLIFLFAGLGLYPVFFVKKKDL